MDTPFTPEAIKKEETELPFFGCVLMTSLLALVLIGAYQVFLVWIPFGIHSYAQSEVNTYVRTHHTVTECTTSPSWGFSHCETNLLPD